MQLSGEGPEARTGLWHRLRLGLAARRSPRAGYDAFISYSHRADARLAPILQRSLHGFARPWFRLRAMRVFRDVASLAATAGLMSAIESVLGQTRYLILLASPTAAKSPWVAREARFWCEQKSSQTLLIVLTDGEVAWNAEAGDFEWEKTSALPPVLSGRFSEEPLLVDLRWAREFERLGPRHPRLREATATLAATIHGRPRDSLIGDDIRRHRRAIQVAIAAMVLIAGFAAVASWQYVVAREQRSTALEQARQATSLALSASSSLQLAEHPKTALLLGLEAYQLRPRAEARSALLAAMQVSARTGAGPILRGHTDIARAAAFSPDGRTLVSVGDDAAVRVWDLERRRETGLSPLRGHQNLAMAVDVSPDGRLVASGSWDGTVRLWELDSDAGAGTVLRRGATVQSVAFGPRGLLAIASGHAVEVWAYRDRRKLAAVETGDEVDAVAFSSDGRLVAAAVGVSGEALLWNLSTGTASKLPHGGIATAVAFSADDRTLVVGGYGDVIRSPSRGGTVTLWDVRARRRIGRVVRTGTEIIRGVALADEDRTLFAAGEDGRVARVAVGRREVLGYLPHVSEDSGIWGLAISRDRRQLAIAASDGSVRLWNVSPASRYGSALQGSGGEVAGIAVSPDGGLAAVARDSGSIDLFDTRRARLVQTLRQDTEGLSAVAFDASGKAVVFADDGHLRVWNPRSGDVVTMPDRIPAVSCIAVSRDGRLLATGELDGRVRIWDLRARKQIGEPIETPMTVPRGVSFVAFAPDGESVAFAAGDFMNQSIRLVELASRRIVDSTDGIWPLDAGAVLPNGTVRAATIKHPEVTVVAIHPAARGRIRVGSASEAELSPDGSTLLVGGENGAVRAWDAAELKPLGSVFGDLSSRVTELSFSADGKTFAAAGENGTVRVWRNVFWSRRDEIRERACRDAGSSIPRAEWASAAPGIGYRKTCG